MAFRETPSDESKPNLTPMIDMTFLLVIFFMVSIDLTQKEFVPVDLPYARAGVEDVEDPNIRNPIPRMVINLLNNGDILLKGKQMKLASGSPQEQEDALAKLVKQLSDLTKDPKYREPDNSSKIPVLIHGDRNARWQYVQWIMMVCADPKIGIYKIQFAVKKPMTEDQAAREDAVTED